MTDKPIEAEVQWLKDKRCGYRIVGDNAQQDLAQAAIDLIKSKTDRIAELEDERDHYAEIAVHQTERGNKLDAEIVRLAGEIDELRPMMTTCDTCEADSLSKDWRHDGKCPYCGAKP